MQTVPFPVCSSPILLTLSPLSRRRPMTLPSLLIQSISLWPFFMCILCTRGVCRRNWTWRNVKVSGWALSLEWLHILSGRHFMVFTRSLKCWGFFLVLVIWRRRIGGRVSLLSIPRGSGHCLMEARPLLSMPWPYSHVWYVATLIYVPWWGVEHFNF